MVRDIFISHAAKDKALADALVDLLQLGLNVSTVNIFCSSLEGMGIPSGADFIGYIKDQIQSPKVVVALITPNYLASQFCLSELGATWAMSHRMFPLMVPSLAYKDVKGVLAGTQLTKINRQEDLSDLRDNLIEILSLEGGRSSRWEKKRDKFLQELPEVLNGLPEPDHVPVTAYNKALQNYEGAKRDVDELEVEVEKLKSLISKLEKVKDKKEVAAIKRVDRGEEKALDDSEKAFALILDALPKCVATVAWKQLGGQHLVKIDAFKNESLAESLESAHGDQLIDIDESGFCTLNEGHPKIRRLMKAYKHLEGVISTLSSEFVESFEADSQITLSLNNREYWAYSLEVKP